MGRRARIHLVRTVKFEQATRKVDCHLNGCPIFIGEHFMTLGRRFCIPCAIDFLFEGEKKIFEAMKIARTLDPRGFGATEAPAALPRSTGRERRKGGSSKRVASNKRRIGTASEEYWIGREHFVGGRKQ